VKRIRYGMIGFGGIAEHRLAREGFALDRGRFAPLAEAELAAATDLNPARRAAAESLGLTWHADAAALLAAEGLDAVVIATNNATHAPLARAALERNLHVLVEKPMATRSAAAAELCALARARGLSLAVDHMMTENGCNRRARLELERGTLGDVNDAVFHMEFLYGATPAEAASWRCSDPAELGGPIGDVASHCLYMAEFLFQNEIQSLACVYHPKQLPIAVENGATIRFRLENGLTGTIRVSFADARGGLEGTLSNLGYEIYGARGALRGYGTLFQLSGHPGEPVPVRLELERFASREDLSADNPGNIYQAVVQRHARSILEGKPMNGRDGWRNLRLVESCHASAQAGGVWRNTKGEPEP